MIAGAEEKLLAWLIHCANAGEYCPTNEAIRRRFGGGEGTATRWLQALEQRGKIRLARTQRPRGRIVTIVETGKSTAAPVSLNPRRAA